MRQKFLVLIIILSLKVLATAAQAGGAHFIQNKGQWPKEVLYRTEIPGGFLFLKKNSFVYVLYDQKSLPDIHNSVHAPLNPLAKISSEKWVKAHGVEVAFLNANENTTVSPVSKIATTFSYFLSKNESQWAGSVPAFEEITYQNIYPGINLRLYWQQFKLKYEFAVSVGADPAHIKMKYLGADKISINSKGELTVNTSVTPFKEKKPYCFQKFSSNIQEVNSHFEILSENLVAFKFPVGFDKTKPLIVDPELIFSTYSGSVVDNWGHTATYDDSTNLYAGGTVFGVNFPVTVGAFQTRFQGLVDVAILKFSPDGSNLVYATYLGGESTDVPTSLFVNSNQELLIFGTTSSKNFPVSSNAFQKAFGGGTPISPISGLFMENGSDLFISKLSNNGSQLVGSSYFGGSGNDGLSDSTAVKIRNYGDSFRGEIIADAYNRPWIASSTNSGDLASNGVMNGTLSGRQDGLVARFSEDLSALEWATYVGGSGFDAAFSIKISNSNDVYIAGITNSKDLPVHSNALQSQNKGLEDAYVARFTYDKLSGLTYLGTAEADGAYLIDLDASNQVYVYGLSRGDYPVSQGVYSNAKSGQFVQALDAHLSKSIFSTTIGSGRGVPDISPTAFLVNECGNIYLAGWGGNINSGTKYNNESSTLNMPITEDAIQPITNGNNFYIAILEQNAKSLLYATYFGNTSNTSRGDHVDGGTSRFSKDGVIYHATCACDQSRFPTTPQAWSQTNRSENCNNAAFKIDIDRLHAAFDVYAGNQKNVTRGCAPLAMSFVNMSEGGIDYIWEINGGTISREADQASYTFTVPGTYTVTLKAYNRLSCKRIDIVEKEIVVESLNAKIISDTTVCENSIIQLWAMGAEKYLWSPAAGLDDPTSANPKVKMTASTVYSVEMSSALGCKVTKDVKVNVFNKTDFIAMPPMEQCVGQETVLNVTGQAAQYQWFANGLPLVGSSNSLTVNPTATTLYTIVGIYEDGCRPERTIELKVDRSYEPQFTIAQSGGDCNQAYLYSMHNTTANATRFKWDLGQGTTEEKEQVENFLYETAGEYTVGLTAYNAKGCALTTVKKLTTEPPFTLANVVTPNGDGKNDSFVVPVANSQLEVFNRWGKQVFKNVNYQDDWGKDVPNGTYFYVVDTPLGRHCKGWIEVIE